MNDTTAAPGQAAIEHVILLVLENRSFDHLLGYLQHPSPDFDGLRGSGPFGNHLDPADAASPWYLAEASADYVMPVDPDHEHYAVLGEITQVGTVTNAGFAHAYMHKALATARGENRRLILHAWSRRLVLGAGLAAMLAAALGHWTWTVVFGVVAAVGLVGRWFTRARPVTPKQQAEADAVAPVVMHAFAPEKVPVISTLATEFALCQRWFCSVPGETWPNRNFFHAGHSSGSVDIELGFYRDRTIFQILDEAKKTWRVYYGQFPPQVFFFPYVLEHSIHGSGSLQNLFTDIEQSSLANYTFVEPHHGLLHQRPSCSQHPSNNLKGKDDGSDFRAGERLIAEIYQRLAANPELFTKTLLVVTYDEHGGLYDHRRPPPAITAGDRQDTWSRRIVRWLEARHFPMRFDFRRLGPRVPCLVISPWIPAATLDCRVHDHTSLPRTLRKLFAPHARFLSLRERRAPTIETLLTLPRPRTRAGGPAPTTDPSDRPLPDLSAAMQQLADPPLFAAAAAEAPAQRPAVNFEWELLALTDAIRRKTVPPPGTPLAVKHPSRRQAGLLRLRRLRAKSTKELAQLYTDTQFTLGVMAAEQTEH